MRSLVLDTRKTSSRTTFPASRAPTCSSHNLARTHARAHTRTLAGSQQKLHATSEQQIFSVREKNYISSAGQEEKKRRRQAGACVSGGDTSGTRTVEGEAHDREVAMKTSLCPRAPNSRVEVNSSRCERRGTGRVRAFLPPGLAPLLPLRRRARVTELKESHETEMPRTHARTDSPEPAETRGFHNVRA